jgi:hypothetical protein
MVTELPLRMQNRCSALRALFDELCSTENTIELLFEHMREVTTFWAKTVAVDILSFAGHEHPFEETITRTRKNAFEIRRFESVGGNEKGGLGGRLLWTGVAALRCAIPSVCQAGRRAQTET